MLTRSRAAAAVLATIATLFVLPASAQAFITSTNVTSPSNGSRYLVDVSSGAPVTEVTFTGTSNPTTPTDAITLSCVNLKGDGSQLETVHTLANNVQTDENNNGAWSVTVNLTAANFAATCLVRAFYDAGPNPPGTMGDQTGPTVSFSRFAKVSVGGGINAGKVVQWQLDAAQREAKAALMSPWACALCATEVYSGDLLQRSDNLWYYVSELWGDANQTIKGTNGVTVDGQYAYTPDGVYNSSFAAADGDEMPGLLATDVSVVPAVDGSMVATEQVPLVRCNAGSDQAVPTGACTALVPTGVTLTRTWTIAANGRRVAMNDAYASTDGAAHTVRAQYWSGATGGALELSWYNGGAPFPLNGSGATIPTPPSTPWASLIRNSAAPAGADSLQFPWGAEVTNVAPETLSIAKNNNTFTTGVMPLTVPAGGSASLERVTLATTSRAEAVAFMSAEADRMVKPVLALSAPTEGTRYEVAPIVVAGTVTDNVGIASLTVNGVATPVSGGAFSTAVTPVAGANTVTVVAKDAAGNAVALTRSFTYQQKTFTGTAKNDKLVGNSGSNVLDGLAGNDTIDCGVGGKDQANGGAGNDKISCVEPLASAKANADVVNCGPGKRDVAVVDPFDKVIGCELVTRVWIGSGTADRVKGTKANDRFDLKGGNDVVTCGGGTDTVAAGAGSDTINCVDRGRGAKKSKDVVNCGPGTKDKATVDKFDKVVGCERVKRV